MSAVNIKILTQIVNNFPSQKLVLMKNTEVLKWLYNDLSFLEKIDKKSEDIWGRNVMKSKRSDLKLDKQWTNCFGEYICEEIMILLGYNVFKPTKKENFQPDLEVDDCILEVKTQTYLTSGTAGEKILGTPFKYSNIPRLYSKPLTIVCIGNAEILSRENYGNLPGSKMNQEKKNILDFYRKSFHIQYIGASQLLKQIINKQS